MCIKIVYPEYSQEFDIALPLEEQVLDANQIIVDYDPTDPKIPCFVGEVERMVKNGISCNVNIKVDSNNDLDGIRLERKLENLTKKLEVNEVIKRFTKFHAEVDCKLGEISKICLGKMNE
jgi:cell fate (sporulation/competence/biofilm development) regulator YlbF (YheA/YmcA/DUF963 family)